MKASALSSFGNVAGVVAFGILPIMSEMKKAQQEHKSRLWAGVSSGISYIGLPIVLTGFNFTKATVAFTALGAVTTLPAFVDKISGLVQTRNQWIRQAATPFSHRFDASDWTAAAQQRGMQAMNGYKSMIGNEA